MHIQLPEGRRTNGRIQNSLHLCKEYFCRNTPGSEIIHPIHLDSFFKSNSSIDMKNKTKYNTHMDRKFTKKPADSVSSFHLPRYSELPDVGLYLEQTTTYINDCLMPLGCMEITNSMISNYVKKGFIANPVKKKYSGDQIAHLICLTILKHVLSLENICKLFQRQEVIYTNQVAYDYFCMELENILFFQFELKDSIEDIGHTTSLEKQMLRSAIISVCHIIYLHFCFRELPED